MLKRGQISVFIIVGILLLVPFVIYNLSGNLSANLTKGPSVEETSSNPIQLFVESCISKTIKDGLIFNYLQGGFYEVENGVTILLFDVPLLIKNGNAHLPRKFDFEQQLKRYIEENIHSCLDDFSVFKDQGLIVEVTGKPEAFVNLVDLVEVELNYPLSIQSGDSITKINSFFNDLYFDFTGFYVTLSTFMAEHQKNPNDVPIGFLSYYGLEEGFTYVLHYLDNDIVLYSLTFDSLLSDNSTLVYNFGAHYDW